ncbi:hypothetical protein O181_130380 [Austropuccinia psidii MF-1]|uniref:Uncharacterized protein n=1 Tax=Austropuccinia psidii MF-1 TaxID=1389203 RepID=A0A9Q3L3L8_9BASI|nr:hypothetical protein [Austropuccinia psidii MF-1]
MEENFIRLEERSQGYSPVTTLDTQNLQKGKRKSESLIKTKKWTGIAPQRPRKPHSYASIQVKPTLITYKGKMTVTTPVVTSKGKFLKAAERKFVQGTVRGR